MSIDEASRSRILDWASPAFPLSVREEAARILVDYVDGKSSEDTEGYATELRFGTGGLRGVIGNGAGRMNRWTVGRTTLGFCRYLAAKNKKPSLVIAFDSRRKSTEFARVTAGVAAALGFEVYLFDRVTSTPILSYAIRHLKASGGVVITASHNPPEYNGYKVYLSDGGQLVGSAQEEVEAVIDAIQDWGEVPFPEEDSEAVRKHVHLVGDDIKKAYIAEYEDVPFVSGARTAAKKNFRIVYSPLHGTGGLWLPDLLKHYGFRVDLVPQQQEPDGEFPTVKLPNPEEREALRMAEDRARELNADMFLATDPDADRLGAGFRGPNGYVLLNGNQIGSMMCAFLCERLAKERLQRKDKNTYYVLKTIVTTDLQKAIADSNGVEIRDVLTGFKYIAEQMQWMEDGRHGFEKGRARYLFGGEESYGYLPVDFVRDKDSLASALLLCEIAIDVGDLVAYLDQVYLRYGLYLEDLKSVTMKGLSGQAKIQQIIEQLRSSNLIGWELGPRTVTGVLDFELQTRNGKKDPKTFDGLPPANVLQLLLEPEGKLTIRPSGTEPKVKLYASLKHPEHPQSLDELQIRKQQLRDELASLSGAFFARAGLAG